MDPGRRPEDAHRRRLGGGESAATGSPAAAGGSGTRDDALGVGRPDAGPLGAGPPRLPADPPEARDLDTTDDWRFEYWDGDTETAWVMDLATLPHEQPSARLAGFCALIAAARGFPIERFGSTSLELRDERGERRRILQADQCVYVYPGRARLPRNGGIVVGEHDLPDVLLEVDHTTDVRRWKLGMYESWGLPEVWVEVPARWTRSRARGRVPGLTIHALEAGRYRESPVSAAFPDWRARPIHEAAERSRSVRVDAREAGAGGGGVLGARDGTGPDDHHFLRSFPDQDRVEGRAEGRIEGLGAGRAEGLAESRATLVRQMLVSRNIAVSEGFPADVSGFAEAPEDAVVRTALTCDSEQDFRARISRSRGGIG